MAVASFRRAPLASVTSDYIQDVLSLLNVREGNYLDLTVQEELEDNEREYQSLDSIPGLKDREQTARQRPQTTEHPYQKQVRMEYIHRELNQKMMDGSYQTFIQELKNKGWWDEYQQWLQNR